MIKNSLIYILKYRVLQESGYTFNFRKFRLKLSIVKSFAQSNNCQCITDTTDIYEKLLNVKCFLLKKKSY